MGLKNASHMSPPALSTAATSSAQKKLSPVVCRGQMSDRAIPMLEKGLPICWRANASIRRSAFLLQPSETYE